MRYSITKATLPVYSWPAHIKRLSGNFVNNHLFSLVERFLGSPTDSGLAHRFWIKPLEQLQNMPRSLKASRSKRFEKLTYVHPSWDVVEILKPCSVSLLAVYFFGLHKIIMECRSYQFTDANQCKQIRHISSKPCGLFKLPSREDAARFMSRS
jgi:hypothetical protein